MQKKVKVYIAMVSGVVVVAALAVAWALGGSSSSTAEGLEDTDAESASRVPLEFNADSAYAFTDAQCAFGPRDMNSSGHDRCLVWIQDKFRQYGCHIKTQSVSLKGYDGTSLHCTNIMAQFHPEATDRIMLCAHWDSRPWADNDPDSTNWHKPILAANDAASGVAVMIELARLLHSVEGSAKSLPRDLGIDFVCFDAEDWGTPQWASASDDDGSSWALGAQYFAANLPEGYAPRYGVLLDMVGGEGAMFYQEQMSRQYASGIVDKVWRAARQAGYGSMFPEDAGGAVTDDHIPINQTAHIPTIDIIPYYPDCRQSSFGPTWHTLDDNMEHIDKATLKAVGQTMVQLLFTEKK